MTQLPPTPFYYYDTTLLQRTLQSVRAAILETEPYVVHYAVKANANPRLLSVIASQGFGADCVSGGEVKAAIEAGFPPEKIVFAGVGKTDEEIDLALHAGIFCFNVESTQELLCISERAEKLGKTASIALRINPNVDAHTHQKITTGLAENKFGIDMTLMVQTVRLASELPNLKFIGLHFHIGSQILDIEETFTPLCERINELQEELEAAGFSAPHINVGGGLGIDYERPNDNPIPDFEKYFATFRSHLQLRHGQQLHFELGRSIVGQCGRLITKVTYMKEGLTRKFVILDAGFNDLARVAMYDAYHSIENLTAPDSQTEKYDVVGPICESSDVFATQRELPLTKRGDIVALLSAGAYGETMASTYNLRALPKSYTDADFSLSEA